MWPVFFQTGLHCFHFDWVILSYKVFSYHLRLCTWNDFYVFCKFDNLCIEFHDTPSLFDVHFTGTAYPGGWLLLLYPRMLSFLHIIHSLACLLMNQSQHQINSCRHCVSAIQKSIFPVVCFLCASVYVYSYIYSWFLGEVEILFNVACWRLTENAHQHFTFI